MQGETHYYIGQNAQGDFELEEIARCSVGVSKNTTFILYNGKSTDPESDYEFYELEIISISDGKITSHRMHVSGADVAYIANTFEDAAMKVSMEA